MLSSVAESYSLSDESEDGFSAGAAAGGTTFLASRTHVTPSSSLSDCSPGDPWSLESGASSGVSGAGQFLFSDIIPFLNSVLL